MAEYTSPPEIKLPNSLLSIQDIRGCIRALEWVDDQLISGAVRVRAELKPKSKSVQLPASVQEVLALNKLTLGTQKDVESLRAKLEDLVRRAPRIQFQFASEPDDSLKQRLTAWVRANINPAAIIDLHTMPQLGSGFIVETGRRRYDFSWRTFFDQHQARLSELLNTYSEGEHGK